MAETGEPPTIGTKALALGAVAILALALIEAVLFFLFPQNGYYYGMLYTGILAMGTSIALYLVTYFYRWKLPRLASTGAFWFGAVMLLGADLATPNSAFVDVDQPGANATLARVPLLVFTIVIIGVYLGVTLLRPSTQSAEDDSAEKEEEGKEVEESEEEEYSKNVEEDPS
jgi:peptidoglycan/LPS O-acetylase OafA/YrhL